MYRESFFEFEFSVVFSLCLSISISAFSVSTELSFSHTLYFVLAHTLPHNVIFYSIDLERADKKDDQGKLSPMVVKMDVVGSGTVDFVSGCGELEKGR